jgi:hypothetical protein
MKNKKKMNILCTAQSIFRTPRGDQQEGNKIWMRRRRRRRQVSPWLEQGQREPKRERRTKKEKTKKKIDRPRRKRTEKRRIRARDRVRARGRATTNMV